MPDEKLPDDEKQPLFAIVAQVSVPTRADAQFIRNKIDEFLNSDELQDQQEAAVWKVELWEFHTQ
jgi:hypothetical protein